ncbi:MAG: hypothetical protein ACLFR7_00360 [Opitutales bacterium]
MKSVFRPFATCAVLLFSPLLVAQPAAVREPFQTPPAIELPPPAPTDGPVIKLALLLDTSNSMDGLIHQARTRLWQVVNELGQAHVAGETPQLQVALFHYGNNTLEATDHWVQLRNPFTTDLDVVSEQLFGLSTSGGSEYCGAVIRESVQRLDWGHVSEAPVLRLIVIAGNEPFNQGPTPFAESIATARGLEVKVNTIYCGPSEEGRRTLWAEGAKLGHGHYAAIDQDVVAPEIETPFDDALRRLNDALNATYLGYGKGGAVYAERQRAQDSANFAASASAGLSRTAVKASASYETSHWDLVSAVEEGTVELAAVPPPALPEPLQGKSLEEQEAHLAELAEQRRTTTEEIQALAAKRARFLAAAREATPAASASLEDALLEALRAQAEALGFAFGSR